MVEILEGKQRGRERMGGRERSGTEREACANKENGSGRGGICSEVGMLVSVVVVWYWK